MGVTEALGRARVVVVGSGLFGLTIAQSVAERLGERVVVIERRGHIGGNTYSYRDSETGIEVHAYGTHIFHTSNARVWEYVNRFTRFNSYVHRVETRHGGRGFPIPINLTTINDFYGQNFSPDEAKLALKAAAVEAGPVDETTLEGKAIARLGRPLYEALIKNYTAKQWQEDPRYLPASIINRIPIRFTHDDNYFDDRWQGIPTEGYGAWALEMIRNPLISVFTGVDFEDVRDTLTPDQLVVYTGPLDAYFHHSEGLLGWRTLDFELETRDERDFQGIAVMNYADLDVPFTRVHEFKHLHPEKPVSDMPRTVIMREFSRLALLNDEPYYPVGTAKDRRVLEAYRERAASERNVIFGGRLGTYQYLDMHAAVGSALAAFEQEVLPLAVSLRT